MAKVSAKQLFLVELNEINFEYVRRYVANGKLPNFAECLENGWFSETTSEDSYEKLEPWIQWVTAHTGLTLAEHGVFRLGDIVDHDIPQIWELLEDRGFRVAAISPMNAKNRIKDAAFFLPDPWTDTEVVGSRLVKKFAAVVSKVVNDNATSKISIASGMWLFLGAAAFARPSNYLRYVSLVFGSFRKSWFKAMFLDRLLADMMIKLTRSKNPDFISLFLNAGAHIQHHYLFSSDVYDGNEANPEWYVDSNLDPVLDVYELYDDIIGELKKCFPMSRLLIATGLHQDPHDNLTYYWRLADHHAFLRKHKLPFEDVEPRMSRDFLIKCGSGGDAKRSSDILMSIADKSGKKIFEVDNRGTDLFVMLTYPEDIDDDFKYEIDGQSFDGFRSEVSFVAIKNGQHNGTGYLIDLGQSDQDLPETIPLAQLKSTIEKVMQS